jgi:ADP-ribosylglycohydrolase
MIGAIAGDIIGSVHEFVVTKTTDFVLFHPDCRFTDDTVLTVAVADCLLSKKPYVSAFHHYYRQYPHAGYGMRFFYWAESENTDPYMSFGNGSAMRVSSVGWAFETLDEVLGEAKRTAEPTHNHPEGIKGAQATAAAIFLARQGKSKQEIRASIASLTGYNLDRRLDDIRPSYIFDETCQGTVPEALIAFLESENYEDAVRKAISLGGDADTLACITGSIAEAFYGGVPEPIKQRALERLDSHLRSVVIEFSRRYGGSQNVSH